MNIMRSNVKKQAEFQNVISVPPVHPMQGMDQLSGKMLTFFGKPLTIGVLSRKRTQKIGTYCSKCLTEAPAALPFGGVFKIVN